MRLQIAWSLLPRLVRSCAIGLGFWLSSATESATEISSVAAPTTVSQISIWEIHNQAHLDSPTNRGSKSDLHCERADKLRASLIRLPPLSAGERSGDCLANSASATSHAGAARCFSLDVLDAKLGGPARREFIELRLGAHGRRNGQAARTANKRSSGADQVRPSA